MLSVSDPTRTRRDIFRQTGLPQRGKSMQAHQAQSRVLSLAMIIGVLILLAPVPSASAQHYVFSNASFLSGLRPRWVVTGDFNEDGVEDIAVVNECGSDPTCQSAGSISILLGNPDGTFQHRVNYLVGSDPT